MTEEIEYPNASAVADGKLITFRVEKEGSNYKMVFSYPDGSFRGSRPVWEPEYIMWTKMIKQSQEIIRLRLELELAKQALEVAKTIVDATE